MKNRRPTFGRDPYSVLSPKNLQRIYEESIKGQKDWVKYTYSQNSRSNFVDNNLLLSYHYVHSMLCVRSSTGISSVNPFSKILHSETPCRCSVTGLFPKKFLFLGTVRQKQRLRKIRMLYTSSTAQWR